MNPARGSPVAPPQLFLRTNSCLSLRFDLCCGPILHSHEYTPDPRHQASHLRSIDSAPTGHPDLRAAAGTPTESQPAPPR